MFSLYHTSVPNDQHFLSGPTVLWNFNVDKLNPRLILDKFWALLGVAKGIVGSRKT